MTAVIGIINKSAAAIATDSAVTVTGPKGPKVFNRANKIFRISKFHPVGLMIYNQGEFMGTPWEIIIKEYRKHLGEKVFNTLVEYKNNFIEYLHANSFFCDQQQQKKVLYYLLCDLLNVISQEVINEKKSLFQTQPPNLPGLIAQEVEQKINTIIQGLEANTEFCEEFKDFTEVEFESYGFTGLPQALQQVFLSNGIPINSAIVQPILRRLIFLLLKSKNFLNLYSGLVFVGYGDLEIFPSLVPVNISIGINNRLRYFDDQKGRASINHQSLSAIRPFAQTDVINTVLAGIDPGLNKLYLQQFQDFIVKNNEIIAGLIESTNPDISSKIRSLDTENLTKSLSTLISQERKKHYIDPLMGAVSTLSKEDLAEMAESLVYLTYLKRRFTFAEESVGGPVDVAIITKGDGFVWIKRKHYFNTELNPHFLKNY